MVLSGRGACARRLLAGAALCGVAVAGAAQAQSFSSTGLTFGEPAREIEVNVGTDVIYDTNVSRTNETGVNTRGLEREDVLFRPRVEGNVSIPTGPFVFSLSGLVGYDFYARNTELNRERIDLNANAGFGSTRCGVLVNGGYQRAQNDLRDLSIVPGDPVGSTVNVQTVKRIGASASCGAEVGFRPMAMVEYRTSDNSASIRRISNYEAVTYGGGLVYSNPAFGVLTTYFGISDYDYTDRDAVAISGIASEFKIKSVGVRLDRRLGARLQFNGQVSYVGVEVDGQGNNQYEGVNWDVSATLRASPRLQLTAGAARVINASSGFTSDFANTSVYSLGAEYAITERLRLSATAAHQTREFDVGALQFPGQLSEDELNQLGLRLNFQRSPRLRFSLFGSYEDRKADLDLFRYDRFNLGLGVSILL